MYVFTQYYGDSWDDHATARIAVIYSADQGETWTTPEVLVEKGENDLNLMSISLLRMENGDLGLMYLRKFMKDEKLLCMPFLIRSSDEGKTFSAPVSVVTEDDIPEQLKTIIEEKKQAPFHKEAFHAIRDR